MTWSSNEARVALAGRLREDHPEWEADEPVLMGGGLEFFVFRIQSARQGPLAIKVPRAPIFINDNDPRVVARDLLEQEAALISRAARGGIPVPRLVALELGREPLDYLVLEYVEHAGGEPSPRALGELVRRLHSLPELPSRPLVAQQGRPLAELLAERIHRRARVVERLAGVRLALPGPEWLADVLHGSERPRAVLHMDVRPANVLAREGQVLALLDWSNALVGDPALELARIAEYGLAGPEFLAAYHGLEPLPPPPARLELLYRIDTAVMLAVVFLSEQPDAEKARPQVARVVELCGRLEGTR
ncbi:hypothetical protein CYFUS_001294 [Cystobacter fuscus]|uniref:Protein kinase domain-containing protein n=1 Tax=Cystobacter fuscus TaxID=43 RepID=A0A250IX85_9BACT|nr:phosphotransferase [Cystobacter fuscus]ATB35880.1 hypothetical protein CYFUS_001294 [Cystobacter fuscus]